MIDDLDKVKPTGGKERSEQQNSIENTSVRDNCSLTKITVFCNNLLISML